MSRITSPLGVFATLMTTVAVAEGVVAAQTVAQTTLQHFQDFTRVAFPELDGQQFDATFSMSIGFDRNWKSVVPSVHLSVKRRDDHHEHRGPVGKDDSVILTGSYVSYPPDTVDVGFSGSHVNSASIEAIIKDADGHPEWKLNDLERALKKRGAKHSIADADRFLERFALNRFAGILGPARNIQAWFAWRPRIRDTTMPDFVTPMWIIKFEVGEGTSHACYALFAEPIDGRVTGLSQRRCE